MKWEILKGSEKDFDGAPDSAVYVLNFGGLIYADSSMVSIESSPYEIDEDRLRCYLIAERRPITEPVVNQQLTTEWDGEGLMPSPGMKCLAKQNSQVKADEFFVVAIKDGAVFGFWTSTGAPAGLDVDRWVFLPFPSPSDVAREKITLNMLQYMYSSDETDYAQVCKIYDAIAAGDIPGVKLE